ncbi:hypothetical protein OUZ56_002696 [Daphnia magna]|uniref:Uncharacterized protein n=1 Tax=Daphnia magna TaxID=35525 RepID=A0ABR0A6K6_9CRUS|nr:hypothetical protein OUZ56_002696 [Daphnia magna]
MAATTLRFVKIHEQGRSLILHYILRGVGGGGGGDVGYGTGLGKKEKKKKKKTRYPLCSLTDTVLTLLCGGGGRESSSPLRVVRGTKRTNSR